MVQTASAVAPSNTGTMRSFPVQERQRLPRDQPLSSRLRIRGSLRWPPRRPSPLTACSLTRSRTYARVCHMRSRTLGVSEGTMSCTKSVYHRLPDRPLWCSSDDRSRRKSAHPTISPFCTSSDTTASSAARSGPSRINGRRPLFCQPTDPLFFPRTMVWASARSEAGSLAASQ
jgi:hypothetical protein